MIPLWQAIANNNNIVYSYVQWTGTQNSKINGFYKLTVVILSLTQLCYNVCDLFLPYFDNHTNSVPYNHIKQSALPSLYIFIYLLCINYYGKCLHTPDLNCIYHQASVLHSRRCESRTEEVDPSPVPIAAKHETTMSRLV